MRVHFDISPRARSSQQLNEEQSRAVLGEVLGQLDGLECSFNVDPARTDFYLADAEVLVVAGPVELADLSQRGPKLKWVQLCSAGVEREVGHIPKYVELTNVRGVHSAQAGEFSIMALLMLNNRIPTYATQQRNREWRQLPAATVDGKTVAVMGLGALGGACAEWSQKLGLRVIGVTRSGQPHTYADEVLTFAAVQDAFRRSDFVIIALPSTNETRGCIGRAELDSLPRHAGVVNIGRADVLDHSALVTKLREGSLSGAVLDVFDQEPLPAGSELWSVPNLFITPHCGLDHPDNFGIRCLQIFARNLEQYRTGRPLLTPVNIDLGY